MQDKHGEPLEIGDTIYVALLGYIHPYIHETTIVETLGTKVRFRVPGNRSKWADAKDTIKVIYEDL
jgi:hypothetical protein